jgi:hypothetical protein
MRKKWYKKEEYDAPREPFELGDGSIVEVVGDPDDRHPEALKTTRIWPDGLVTVRRHVPPSAFSHRLELSIDGDREPVKPPKESLDVALANGSYRAPFAITSPIPGNKPGDTWDSATQRHFETRQKFNEYYKQAKLEKVSPSDRILDQSPPAESAPSNINSYDVAKGPPVPSGFEGVKFRAVTSHAQADSILRSS